MLINDRYGKGSRGHHGDVYNVEYHYGIESEGLLTHKWSYWRGVGKTYGYNKDTSPEDCLTVGKLIHMVVSGVSKNGNFDINVGPTASGIISDIEREPLLALGKWLDINTEYSAKWPNINRKGEPPADADEWRDKPGKLEHFSPNPGQGN